MLRFLAFASLTAAQICPECTRTSAPRRPRIATAVLRSDRRPRVQTPRRCMRTMMEFALTAQRTYLARNRLATPTRRVPSAPPCRARSSSARTGAGASRARRPRHPRRAPQRDRSRRGVPCAVSRRPTVPKLRGRRAVAQRVPAGGQQRTVQLRGQLLHRAPRGGRPAVAELVVTHDGAAADLCKGEAACWTGYELSAPATRSPHGRQARRCGATPPRRTAARRARSARRSKNPLSLSTRTAARATSTDLPRLRGGVEGGRGGGGRRVRVRPLGPRPRRARLARHQRDGRRSRRRLAVRRLARRAGARPLGRRRDGVEWGGRAHQPDVHETPSPPRPGAALARGRRRWRHDAQRHRARVAARAAPADRHDQAWRRGWREDLVPVSRADRRARRQWE